MVTVPTAAPASDAASTVCDWHARLTTAPPPDPARLQAILARPAFSGAREPLGGGWTRFREWLWAWISDALTARPMQSFASGTRFLVLALATVVVVFGLYRWGLHRWARRRRIAKLPSPPAVRARHALTLHEPSVHLEAARGLLASQPREALRETLLALLSSLEVVRWARPDRVKTNRELAWELIARGAPEPLAQRVQGLLSWYDGVFYSLAPVPGPEAQRFLEQVDQLQREVQSA